jgi:hypothetical protein
MFSKLFSFIKSRRLVLFIIGIGILFLLVFGLLFERPKTPPVPSGPSRASSSEGLIPGESSVEDLEKLKGPLSVIPNEDGTITHTYGLETDPQPIEVIVKDGRVTFLKKRPTGSDPLFLEEYVKRFGEYDFSMYSQEPGFKAHVFLEAGLVVVAQEVKGDVIELQYFTPTTEEDFLKLWGENFLEVSPTQPPNYY